MPFDGIVTSGIVWELNQYLLNGKIEKIYQPEQDEIIMNIRAQSKNHKLLISSNSSYPRMHLTYASKNNPQTPPNFCMFLRKHIQGGKIASITQRDFERIIELEIESYNELGFITIKKMIVEIMGKHSNIILIDTESNKILDCIKKISLDVNRYRQILPGREYVLPPNQNKISPLSINKEIFEKRITTINKGSLFKSIYQSFQGLSPFIARQLCELSDIDPDIPSKDISNQSKETLFINTKHLIDTITSRAYNPCIVKDSNNAIIDFYAVSTEWMSKYFSLEHFDTISSAVESFYFNRDAQNRLKQKSSDLLKHVHSILDKLGLKKQKLTEELLKAEKADRYRLYGELINANLYRLNDNRDNVILDNYYEPGEKVKISLNPNLTPSENAQKFFKKYNKAKKAYVEKQIQLEETDKELAYFESVLQNIENAQTPEDIEEIRQELIDENYIRKKHNKRKVKKTQSKPLSFTSSDGFTIYVGKNNKQNDILTLKTAAKHDVWLHTKEIPGSHVIVFTQGQNVPEQTLMEAAALAAYHSKGKMSENVPVDYTYVKNVKKPNGAKPGMVIYDHHNTVYVHPKKTI